MADDPKPRNVMNDVYFFVGILAVLVLLWYFSGGPSRSDLRGIFLSPPQPLGTGEAYGPQPGEFQGPTVPPPDSFEGYQYNQ